MLDIKDLSVTVKGKLLLDQVSFQLEAGECFAIVGPNGAGKSTMIRAIANQIDYQGEITYRGQDLSGLSQRERAQKIGILMQIYQPTYAFTVKELVELGAYSRQPSHFKVRMEAGRPRLEEVLTLTGLSDQADQSILTLSGGELQRALLAQVILQDPQVLILDEPGNYLDLIYEREIFDILATWLGQGQRAVLMVLHDLSLAKQHADRGLLLKQGQVVSSGPIDQLLSPDLLEEVYGMDVVDYLQGKYAVWS